MDNVEARSQAQYPQDAAYRRARGGHEAAGVSKRLFHLMPDAEWKRRQKAKQTWGDILREYRQPEWCSYPGALDGLMGCWSIIGRKVKDEEGCKGCECYRALKAKA